MSAGNAALSLRTRLLAAMVALVILTAGTFGLFTYRSIQAVLMQAPGGLESHAYLVAAVRQSTILAGLVAVAGAIVLAVLTARSLTGPLGGMTQAVVAFGREEEKFRLAVELCPSGMLMADHTGAIVMVNSEVERLFGYHREELIGQSIDLLVPDRSRVRHAQQRREFAARPHGGRLVPERELAGQRKDGTEFPIEVRLTSIGTKSGSLILSVIVDITERKEIESLKREFVATVSHELRTPLTSIAGSLSLVAGGAVGELPDAAKRLLTIAYSNSLRLGRLVNNILDFERLESGKLELDLREVDVKGLIEEAIEANAIYSESLQVRVRLDAGDDAKVAVRADADRLTQVLVNLLSNAAKFSPPGQEVLVSVKVRGDHVRISVRDHGPGIPPGFKARIFEKFAQGDQTGVRQLGGTGLGLSIVKQIMNGLGGEIGFEEAPGGGAIFNVDIPRWDAAAILDVEVPRKMSA